MTHLFTNFAESTIADVGGIGVDATTFSVQGGHGVLFPSPGAGESFYIVCVKATGEREIMKCTDVTVDTLTVVRAQEGTTALVFEEDDKVSHRVTAGTLGDFMQKRSQCVYSTNVDGSPNVSSVRFNVTPAGVTHQTLQTVGPTGSGAKHTWLALNAVPDDVDWLEISCFIERTGADNNAAYCWIAAHLSASGAGTGLGGDDYICTIDWQGPISDLNARARARGDAKVPVIGRVFSVYWDGYIDSGYTFRVTLTLTGYGYNS